jgi:hypothetical protein
MYQSIYYDFSDYSYHLRDDKKGWSHFNYQPTYYKLDEYGTVPTLDGQMATPTKKFERGDLTLYERDVDKRTRLLIDNYYESDDVAEWQNIVYFDIECEIGGALTPEYIKSAPMKMTSIAIYDHSSKIYYCLILDEKNQLTSTKQPNREIIPFPTEKDTLNSSVKVIKPKINSGYLIADFESGYNNLWTKFVQSGASMDSQIRNVKPIPQGDNFYNMAGTVNWDWLVSLIDFNANANGVDRFPLNTNPNNIYFNAMGWGEPGLDNTLLLFQFKEDDNTNGTFESSSEDQYDYQLKIDWSGWKLISIKYSDLGSLVNGEPAIPKGNKQRNPNNLVRLSVLHLADPSSGFAKTKIDYIIFTDSKSLEP